MAKRKRTWQRHRCQFCYEEGHNARARFVVKINFGMNTSAYEKKVPISEMLRNTALANDFKHLGLLGRSLDKWENEELVQNSSYPWTSGSHLGLLGQSLDKWKIKNSFRTPHTLGLLDLALGSSPKHELITKSENRGL